MKVAIDDALCDRQGLCVAEAPSVFDFDDDDFINVVQPEPPESLRSQVARAVRVCPKNAISVEG